MNLKSNLLSENLNNYLFLDILSDSPNDICNYAKYVLFLNIIIPHYSVKLR